MSQYGYVFLTYNSRCESRRAGTFRCSLGFVIVTEIVWILRLALRRGSELLADRPYDDGAHVDIGGLLHREGDGTGDRLRGGACL